MFMQASAGLIVKMNKAVLVRCLDDLENVKSMVSGPAAPNQSLMHFTGQPPACDPRLDIVYYTPRPGTFCASRL